MRCRSRRPCRRPEDFEDEGRQNGVARSLGIYGPRWRHGHPGYQSRHGLSSAPAPTAAWRTSGLRQKSLRAARSLTASARLVVPGSGLVKEAAEAEGLDVILTEAGFEWREPGCSMCLAMNADKLAPGERSASTSNRNFEGRQGPGGRTHLVSPGDGCCGSYQGPFG